MRTRKTDKWRLREGRGLGVGADYKSWLKVHEVPSKGRASRPLGWKNNRVYELLSDLEYRFFLAAQYDDDVIDIREQFPLLPIEQTKKIAEELQIIHPPKSRKDKMVMTTDFLLTLKGKPIQHKAIAIKPSEELKNPRTMEKLCIEEKYWEYKGIPFCVITEEDIDVNLAKNLELIYPYYWWDIDRGYSQKKVKGLIEEFKRLILEGDSAMGAVTHMEQKYEWEERMGISFLYYMIAHKAVRVDLSQELDIRNIKINLEE